MEVNQAIEGYTDSSETISVKWHRLKWLLPLLFVWGYLATYQNFTLYQGEYLMYTVISIVSLLILLTKLKPPFSERLPFWVMLGVFLFAYYFKFYLMIDKPKVIDEWIFYKMFWLLKSHQVFINTYSLISFSFAVFCAVSYILLFFQKDISETEFYEPKNKLHIIFVTYSAVAFLIFITSSITKYTGILKMGDVSVYLPFRLAGWIYYTRAILVPALLVLAIWISDKSGKTIYLVIGVVLLTIHGVSDMVLRSSKGSLLAMFVLVMFMFMATRRLTWSRIRGFLIVVALTIIMFPVFGFYRYYRLGQMSVSMEDAMVESFINIYSGGGFWESFSDSSYAVVRRITGADSLLPIIGTISKPLGLDALSIDPNNYFTFEIMQFPIDWIGGLEPSLLGWYYIVGGGLSVYIGIAIFVLAVIGLWRLLTALNLKSLPVARAMLLLTTFQIFSGGFLSKVMLIVIVATIGFCEFMLRTLEESLAVYKRN